MYLITDYERVNEQFRNQEAKENLYLTLQQKDPSIPTFKCRASGVLKKSLESQNSIYRLFKSHEFFITHKDEKQSKQYPDNKYDDFSIFARPKVKRDPHQ